MDPPSYTLLENGETIRITRVREVFTLQEKTMPFERQTVRNESMPEGQTMLVQTGVTGTQQITFRQVLEDNREISNTVFKTQILSEPLPEIVMVGVQKPFTSIPIPGKLAYLASGNAWLMETNTGSRLPLVTTGDLDGYIFSLSPKGDWLLFTRKEKSSVAEGSSVSNINSLWAVDLTDKIPRPVNLKVFNVIHYADWVPGRGLTILYSTVEPRAIAPGWQANNDLRMLNFASSGATIKDDEILHPNAGGIYGWWGTSFALSPDGALLAYARPDGIGLVDLKKKELQPLTEILPLQTGGDWAWVTGLGWAHNHAALYFVTHVPKAGLESQETSPLFDLAALPLYNQNETTDTTAVAPGPLISLVPQTGMFAYPVPSPLNLSGGYKVAYLQAIFPEQSETRRYRLVVMDRDGSNRQTIFPPEDYQGLSVEKSQVLWSPSTFQNGSLWLAVNYQGNLWLVDSENGQVQQVTGDGLISRLDWK
jgi:resuscitation-promoting factor RpfB